MTHGNFAGTQMAFPGAVYSTSYPNYENSGPMEFKILRKVTAAELIATSTAGSSTGVELLADADVPAGMKVAIKRAVINVPGTSFGGATSLKLSDTGGSSGIDFLTMTLATWVNATAPAMYPIPAAAATGISVGTPIKDHNSAGVAGKGLCLRGYHASSTALSGGSTVYVEIEGYFIPA